MTNMNDFLKAELDKRLVKVAGDPPPLPEEVNPISPWDDDKEKTLGSMSKDELANFIRELDDLTFNELKAALDKVELPDADDIQNAGDRDSRPTVETLGPEETDQRQEFLTSPEFDAAFSEWLNKEEAGTDQLSGSEEFDKSFEEYERVASVRLSKRNK